MANLTADATLGQSSEIAVFEQVVIRGYRGHEELTLEGLGRINLLVGTNNSGKTSVIEALEILGAPRRLLWPSARRGETPDLDTEGPWTIRHLFGGHVIPPMQGGITIQGDSARGSNRVTLLRSEQPRVDVGPVPPGTVTWFTMTAEFRAPAGPPMGWHAFLPTDQRAVLTSVTGLEFPGLAPPPPGLAPDSRVQFVPHSIRRTSELLHLFDQIVLTPNEDLLLSVVRLVDPSIERIAPVSGSLMVLRGERERVPMASLGEGAWRLLGLALALVSARGGLLLVDDIDTGLHHSVQGQMWRLMKAAVEQLGVQVFATTHSRDCVSELATIAREGVSEGSQVTIQRIEKGNPVAVAYTEQEIVAAAEHGVEVR